MKKTIIVSLVGLAFTPVSFAAENIELDDVVVTATRTPQARENVIADVTVIEYEEIQRAGQSNLVDILQRQPGIEVTSNGGAGKLSGIFIRGSNTNHVVVLVDGIRINSATAGTTAFENLPVDLIDRIEILRGPAASLYGQDAIGGVIQIFTKKGSGKPQLYASIGYGTYDTKKAQAGMHGAIGDTNFALGVSSQDTDGFSAYKTNNSNLDDDDGYRNLSVTGSLSHKIANGHALGLQLLHSKGKTQFDNRFNSFATNPAFSDNSDLTQHSYSVYSKNKIANNWLSTFKIGEGYDEVVTEGALVPSRSLYRTKQHQWSWQNDVKIPLGTLTLAYDRLEERLKSTDDFPKTSRNNDGYYVGYLAGIGNHTIHANYRSDHNSRFGTNDTHGIAYGYRINDNWRTSVSYGKAFKAPTFNDLYSPFGSNPNLAPEKSENIEAGLRYENDNTQASITLYENKVRNLIALDASFIPFNADKATLKGMTLAASHQLDHWSFGASADIQSPRDDETNNLLVRRANRSAKANVAYQWHDLRIAAEAISSSKRYNDAANKQPLGGYTLFNLTSEYQINPEWKLQASINNLFDKNYALAYDGNPNTTGFVYNTPGSNLFVNIKWESK